MRTKGPTLDRLSALDASFLDQERGGSHMHVGAVMICEGPAPSREEFTSHLESRLHLVPRYRQRLAKPALGVGRPFWVDAPGFDLDYHVRHTALPKPGGAEQLRLLAGRIASQRLDRSKPLWEMWIVEGLEKDRFAIVNKTHHAVVDGVSGIDITTAIFDLEPKPAPSADAQPSWSPPSGPSPVSLAAHTAVDAASTPLRLGRGALGVLQSPRQSLERARTTVEGLGEIAKVMVTASPRSPINGPIGSHRELRWIRTDLDELKAIKNALGGTVNDAFLAVVSGALGHWARERGADTRGLKLRGCVPVSVRNDAERGALGNRIIAMFAELPIDCTDPVERMHRTTAGMQELKESKQAVGADAIAGLQELAPPTILAQASRLQFSSRLYNLLVTNVPGPQFPVYVVGRELREFIPIAFLAQDKRLAVAIVSYNGAVWISLISDRDHIRDLDRLEHAVKGSLRELADAAASAN
jgi:WS/DGAT/MGAT family acyltransferase